MSEPQGAGNIVMFDLDFSLIHRASVTKPRSTLHMFRTLLIRIALRQLLETPRKHERC